MNWRPQEKQLAFLERFEYEALYGGAAGGGKSDALLAEAVRQVSIPHYRGILFRKTVPQLAELLDRARELYGAIPGAKYLAGERSWVFPSGARIAFASMHNTAARTDYQGRRFDYIAFDELTHFTWEEYSYMFSRNRPSGPGTRVYIRAATNPGGIGHSWVRERFINPAPPLTTIYETVPTADGHGGTREMRMSRVFVPSTVFDNRILLQNDPQYVARLAMLPLAERQALLHGSWDAFEGQVFREWRDDPARYDDRTMTHVIAPFKIPAHWHVYRGFDFGYAKPFSVGWYAADEEGRIYRIGELYGCAGAPDTGVRLNPRGIAAEIARVEREDANLRHRPIIGIADPSIFDESRGESVARMMERPPNCIYFSRGDNTRVPGKMQFHYRLAFRDDRRPMLQVFSTCRHFIRTIPALVYDTMRPEDVNTKGEDHIYDECRYVLMENPISAPEKRARVTLPFGAELA